MDKLKEELTYKIRKTLLEKETHIKDIGVISFIDVEVKQVDTLVKGYVNNHYYNVRDIRDRMENELIQMWEIVRDLNKNGIKLHTGEIKNSSMMSNIQTILNRIQEHKEIEVMLQKGNGRATVNVKEFTVYKENLNTLYDVVFKCDKEEQGKWGEVDIEEITPYKIPY